MTNSLFSITIPPVLLTVNEVSVAVRLLLAVLLGGILGFERGRKRRPAGFRTYMIVCMASALIMLTGEYIHNVYSLGDPSRLGAQVVSGIGFLGAGSIIVTDRHVRGITTAAGLWAAAGLGLAVGAGFYTGAILAGACLLVIMTLMRKIGHYTMAHSKTLFLFAEFKTMADLTRFIRAIRAERYTLSSIDIKKSAHDDDFVGADIVITMPHFQNHVDLIHRWSAFEGVQYLEETENS